MENYIKEITPEMTQTVNDLMQRNFADATPEEIEVYARWTQLQAMQSEVFEQNRRLREEECAQRLQAFQTQANAALDALTALSDLAKAKLKEVEGNV